jgi:long-chain acyl-CoA synthetase
VNLAGIIERHPDDSVALVGESQATYGVLRERVARFAGGLAAAGLQPGDRVAIALPSGIDFVVAYLGTLWGGHVAVPLNPLSPGPELTRELATVRPSLLVTSVGSPGPAAESAKMPVRHVAAIDADPVPLAEREPSDPAVLLFTSGTAGAPKAAVLTHGSLLANLEQMEGRAGLASADDVGILIIPAFHVFGLNAVIGLSLYVGASLVLVDRFDAAGTLALIARHGVTTLAGVPAVFGAWATMPGVGGDELSSVRLAVSGAAALPDEVARAFEARFGIPLRQGYGLTEASPAVSFPDPAEPARVGSVGTPLSEIEVRIVDSDGEGVDQGDPGELLVRGPNVFAGYFEDEGATRHVLDRAGWLHTGDVAVQADDGTLTLVDRQKDLIIVSGFNVYPAEVEEALRSHPSVADVAVVGVPDAATGEAVRAVVVPTPELWSPDSGETQESAGDELSRHCARLLARYKCPTQISFVRDMPRGLVGDPLRRALR